MMASTRWNHQFLMSGLVGSHLQVKRYWQEPGKESFLVWKFELHRDDPTPAPWTAKGRQLIADLGLMMMLLLDVVAQSPKQGGSESREEVAREVAAGTERIGGEEQTVVLNDGSGTIRIHRAPQGGRPVEFPRATSWPVRDTLFIR